ncbi:hypothetical protein [Mycolicibacter kumamotonensis]|uniref:Uncharacterized protein n=1 Tax=Mycolicibacter kumamotonensis TaxID=354243 RepID=A0A1B8SKZ7_9MYCO|nr:hypothetical protein [Mycolicibacter kumamotonensis]OBY33422.1 hypothetical protein ACT18_00210 [Mycolicibacter kumamotonensis]
MSANSIHRLDPQNWKFEGSSLVVWINDIEFFEILPKLYQLADDQVQEGYDLTINHTGHVQSVKLGWYFNVTQAQAAARRHIGDQ